MGSRTVPLADQVDRDLVAAMKAREEVRLSTLRMMKSALKTKQAETGKLLPDPEAFAVLKRLVKQRREAAEQFRQGGREELARREEEEAGIIERYLPAPATDAEVDAAISEAIAETGARGAKDLGKVMQAAMARLAGKNADGRQVNERARARLGT